MRDPTLEDLYETLSKYIIESDSIEEFQSKIVFGDHPQLAELQNFYPIRGHLVADRDWWNSLSDAHKSMVMNQEFHKMRGNRW